MMKTDSNRRSGHERRTEVVKKIENVANTSDRVLRLVFLCLFLEILLVGYVFVTEHHGRQVGVQSAREGCERDKADRTASVILNEDIHQIFIESQKRAPQVISPARTRILRDIKTTTAGLKKRAAIDCTERYPDASWFP